MTRSFLTACLLSAAATLPLSAPASAGERDGLRNSAQYEFSSRHRHARSTRMHYYDPYPWWWHPPHVKRARTNYLGWPHSNYPADYDRPYYGGVAGYPGGFWLLGM
jgi:hypothetical protein